MKDRNWFKNEWIGKATLAGLEEAMKDLDYTWGIHAKDSNDHNTQDAHHEDDHNVKLAA